LTEGELRALYDECNRSRFGGRLPRARRDWKEPGLQAWVEWQHPPAERELGCRRAPVMMGALRVMPAGHGRETCVGVLPEDE
jgi:hypothetical protein